MNLIQRIALSIISTDRSLAISIRDLLFKEIESMFPSGYFENSKTGEPYYDTNPEGKGFRPGYVSFALYPSVWGGKNLIGGILFKCVYSSNIKSTSPNKTMPESEKVSPEYEEWAQKGGNVSFKNIEPETIEIEVGFYSKKGNVFSNQRSAGQALVTFDELENIELILANSNFTKTAIEELIDEVFKNPPEIAIGAEGRRQQNEQYTSIGKFINWLHSENRNIYNGKELKALAQGSGQLPNSLRDALAKRGFTLK